ncbi:MAG: hypothetical protein OEM25_05175 [Gammaproteobacteria bacterium]|nr:hypothetical protein [Gammaproteobacteria bacterium]
MRRKKLLLLIAAAILTSSAYAEPESRLGVDATVATAIINAVPAGRRPIALPELQYGFVINLQCAAQMQPESISISVADTRHALNAAEIDGKAVVEASITIPRQQVSPLAIDNFCKLQETGETDLTELSVEGAFTAHISLRCKAEERQSIIYTTAALSLNLQCAHPDDVAATIDQGASPTSTER